jgi:FkbM family methyltransferase
MEAKLRLRDLLSESGESVRRREMESLDKKIGGSGTDLVLFGAGNLGRKVLRKLLQVGIRPLAFIDNNPELWGKSIDGVQIYRPADLALSSDPRAIGVVTTIWCGEASDRMSDRIGPLAALGFERIALFGELAWKFPSEFLPHYSLDLPSKVIEQKDMVMKALSLFSDDYSRNLYVDHIQWRLTADYDVLPEKSKKLIYFDDSFYASSKEEVLFDVGAFTGDSILDFLSSSRGGDYRRIYAFEPVEKNYRALESSISSLPGAFEKITSYQLALADEAGVINVESGNGPASRVGRGTEKVHMTTVDQFCVAHESPTLLKMDIEGFEPQCLAGAAATIARHAPVLAVCVYHMQSHIWEIPLQIASYRAGYRFALCPHLSDGWDLVLYAVPDHRVS